MLLISISFVVAQNETINTSVNKIDAAYDCLEAKIETEGCSSLSLEDKIFSLLTTGKCKTEVLSESPSALGEYWPSTSPSLKTTAQAILALDETNVDTTPAENWLLSQNTTPSDMTWYLQIDSLDTSTCDIEYSAGTYTLKLNEDKTLSADAGNCLKLSTGDFWLKITPGCFDEEFKIKCDTSFQTNLIFKRQTSNVFHLTGDTNSGSADATTTEKVKSSCFKEGGQCNYEGSLWAAFVLDYQGYDISNYMPYLVTFAEENTRYIPEAFLYALTGEDEYRNDLLSRQKESQYWKGVTSGDKFYDTAVALLSISDDPEQKVNTMNWLLEIQRDDGCFPTNTKNNAFLLFSIWPRPISATENNCEPAYYCGTAISCEGNLLPSYSCPGVTECCDTYPVPKTCSEQGGEICSSDQNCVGGGLIVTASDPSTLETCCVDGDCQVPLELSDCEVQAGRCETYSCGAEEVEANYDCHDSSDICCVQGGESSSLWWLWVLIILIILAVVGLIFRKKLQSLFRKKGPRGPFIRPVPPRPGMPLGAMPRRPPIQRRILPPSQRRRPITRPVKKPDELGDVLKKLKDLGK